MFRISFKEDFMDTLVFQDKVTVVTLKGKVVMPDWCDSLPAEIRSWVWEHPSVDVTETWGKDSPILHLEVSAKSKRAEEDTFNPVTGQRIAESRAKIKLYKFMHTLTDKMCQYYFKLVYGDGEVHNVFLNNSAPGLYQVVKKYQELYIKESHHLGELLSKA